MEQRNELGPYRRKLEAGQGQHQGAVGQAHRRPARRDCRQARPPRLKDPGEVRHHEGRSRKAACRVARAPEVIQGKTKMNKFTTSMLAAAVGLALSTDAVAMSKDEHKQAQERIEAQYKADKAGCDAAVGNAKDICRAEAKGKQKVAMAVLEAGYKPTAKA